MAANDIDETSTRVSPRPRPRWRTIVSSSQFRLATLYLVTGAILLINLLTQDAVTINRRVLVAGLIGFAFLLALIHLMILRLTLKQPQRANSQAMRFTESTWSPFQSVEVRDICEHLTPEEKDQLAHQGAQLGRKIGTLLSLPLVLVVCSFLYSIRLFFVLFGLFIVYAFVMEWRLIRGLQRRARQTLCATEYAKARGYHPDTLRMFDFHWSGKVAAGDPSDPD
jgi:hypothetical protein